MKTLRDIALLISVPESSLRLYRDEFEEFLPASGEGRRRRYGDEASARLERIVGWRRSGWTATQIRDELAREEQPAPRVRKRNTEDRLDEIMALLRAQASEIAMLRLEVGALRADIQQLTGAVRADAPLTLEEALRRGNERDRGSEG